MDSQAGIYLSLGSNMGDRRAHLLAGLVGLAAAAVRPVACSALYSTQPVGGPPQSDFLNLALEVETRLTPQELLTAAQRVEACQGRIGPGERWGPRSLDIDVLLYRDRVVDEPGLQVPHPRFHQRRFVLVPLADLAPERICPGSGFSVARLLARCQDPSTVEWLEYPPAFG
jgi:2-amino-4-hydroxy-6-hydroxymethyldihydropteridine diphosphokinase